MCSWCFQLYAEQTIDKYTLYPRGKHARDRCHVECIHKLQYCAIEVCLGAFLEVSGISPLVLALL